MTLFSDLHNFNDKIATDADKRYRLCDVTVFSEELQV